MSNFLGSLQTQPFLMILIDASHHFDELHVHFRIIIDFEIMTFPNSRRSDNEDGESLY
ncbi:hypothetical protein [Peribacillus frigoritolerans]|uniref:hypothetical protein n=1 Tax=Peribacillus frigoritolerans TaxID=450367 RepID=UPI0039A2E637